MNYPLKISSLFLCLVAASITATAQKKLKQAPKQNQPTLTMTTTAPKMKVEIWSDIMCPFCYIGKRHYEAAIKNFTDSANIDLVWHSFQLDPTIPVKQEKKTNVYQYLAERKGMSYEQSAKMHESVVAMAQKAGLSYNFDNAVVANSFDAHRLIQMAKTKGLGDEAEERLFSAYFTEGRDFGEHATLMQLGKDIGLSEDDIHEALTNEDYAARVKEDVAEAQQIGVQGVPFFVFNRKYAISGAQPPDAFLETLKKSFSEWRKDNPASQLEVTNGPSCTPDGECK